MKLLLAVTVVCLTGCSKPRQEAKKSSDATAPAVEVEGSIPTDLALLPQVADQRFDGAIHDIVVREDPTVDGWDSEAFTEQALAQLNALGKMLAGEPAAATAPSVCAPDFSGAPIRPEGLRLVYEDAEVAVRRPISPAKEEKRLPQPIFAAAAGARFKFKIFRVELDDREARTTAYFQMTGREAARRVQINATWECRWTRTDPPRLTRLAISDHEEVSSALGFTDCTIAAIGESKLLRDQLAYGRDHWNRTLEGALGVEERGNGIAIGDINNDGLEDIYLCQPAALPNRLLLRRPDGSLEDISSSAKVDWLDNTRAALFVDLDNDGDQDLALTQDANVLLHENDGKGGFLLRASLPTPSLLSSLNAIDYDSDGDLDLYACGYTGASQVHAEDIFASPMPYHDANNGAPNVLLRNEGNWSFNDVTRSVGLDMNNMRFSLASAWEDFDNDGDPDLFVANDFGRKNLYRNDKGHFIDIAAAAGVEDIGPGMSAAWGDVNNDGLVDLYVSNMFSSAGSRITRQRAFKPGAAADDIEGFQRHARGNSLFINQGDGTFSDQSIESGTSMGRWAWGSLFVDINNDGWRDLYVTNGFITADNNNDL
jgi:FG-GAP-like repeat